MMVPNLFELDKNGVVLLIGDHSNFAFKQFELAKKFELQFSNDIHKIIGEIKRKPPSLIISVFTSSKGDILDIITAFNEIQTMIPMVLFLEKSLLKSCSFEGEIKIVPTDISPKSLLNVVESSLARNLQMLSVSEYTSLICALSISKEIRIYEPEGQQLGRLIIQDGTIIFAETTAEIGLPALQSLLSQRYVQVHFSEIDKSSTSNLCILDGALLSQIL